jgi:methylthioribose-1-phosphate isomerase
MRIMPASPASPDGFSPLRFSEGQLELLDQTKLPREERWVRCETVAEIADAIRRLVVRGAPAIGIAAAYGLVTALLDEGDPETDPGRRIENAIALLGASRPTAVNLRWALDEGRQAYQAIRGAGSDLSGVEIAAKLLDWARALHADDVERNRRMARHGAALFSPGTRALTHCNAGALATGGIGTAIGVFGEAFREGRLSEVWIDETRPLLQGARLTAWEMQKLGIPHRLVTDSMVGALMKNGLVDRVVVGADRIARNGDSANKIGTYTVAVLAARHGVPFHIAAPLSTFDPSIATGDEIPIEERAGLEVTELAGERTAPIGTAGYNLAFDVTPHDLIASIITEEGVLEPPYTDSITRALGLF